MKKVFMGIHSCREDFEECDYDLNKIDAHEGEIAKLTLACEVDEDFEDNYYDAEFEDGFVISGISGIYFE